MRSNEPVSHIMIAAPEVVELGQSLGDVRKAFASMRFHHLPVVRNGKLVGLISSNNLLKLGIDEGGEDNSFLDNTITAGEIMNKDVVTLNHRATIEDAARQLSAGGIHSLPIVDENEHLVGLVTSTDLINFLLEESPPPNAPPEVLEHLSKLEKVMEAAEHYLHSGQGVIEHSRLTNAIEAARKGR